MSLLPFSIEDHVLLLLSGAKIQTTRQPRKNPVKIGDILHCYYKPRQKKTCGNCLKNKCLGAGECLEGYNQNYMPPLCTRELVKELNSHRGHNNFFGKAEVRAILHFSSSINTWNREYKDLAVLPGCEHHLDFLGNQNEEFIEAWARADGFENFAEADKWFKKSTKNDKWMFLPLDVIVFEPEWVKDQ